MKFGKTRKKQFPKKDELIDIIHEFGFEVGYFKHDEEGWVGRKYQEICNIVKESSLDIDVKSHYQTAKNEGIEKRRLDVLKGLSGKPGSTKVKEKTGIELSQSKIGSDNKSSSVKKNRSIYFNSPINITEQNLKPTVIKRVEVIDLPDLLS